MFEFDLDFDSDSLAKVIESPTPFDLATICGCFRMKVVGDPNFWEPIFGKLPTPPHNHTSITKQHAGWPSLPLPFLPLVILIHHPSLEVIPLLTEAEVRRSFGKLFSQEEVVAETFEKAEALLEELRPESPLRHRLSLELEELRVIKEV